jgi:hypothetical protein
MKNYARESRPWLIWLTIFAVILAGVGAYFFYTLFRQEKSELIEAIPTDAAFIFALNDNDGFVSSTTSVAPYLNELFVMDALPAYETMRGKLPAGEYDLTVSGHVGSDGVSLLFNTHADKAAFKRLLRALSIDPNNYTPFENNRIYTYGTNFKSVKFVFLNHIISFSTDMELLKRAIVQHSHPKNLLSDKQFKEIYNLTEKNKKQNWLMIHPKSYVPCLSTFMQDELSKKFSGCLNGAGWTALQLRFSGKDMYLSGYMLADNAAENGFCRFLKEQKGNDADLAELIPSTVNWYADVKYGSSCFSLSADSCNYHYYLVANTSDDLLSDICEDAHTADSLRIAYPNGVYPVINNGTPKLPNIAPDTMNWMFAHGQAIVFAPSQEAVVQFQKAMKNNGQLSQNRLYPFVNEVVASSSVFNFVILNDESTTFWLEQLSEKGRASHFGRELRIFSLSCDAMEKDQHLLPVNLYLHF